MVYNFQVLTKKSEMLPHWALIAQLNNAVTGAYLDEVLDDMIAHKYRMVIVLDDEHCAGLAGIWVATKIYSGKYLEMDNVVVDKDYRSQGIGTLLTNYITQLALNEGCKTMMLDAYLENEKAHTFYERAGFIRRGYHFVKTIG
jgi:GNAT superfamily N-acetyltransferase